MTTPANIFEPTVTDELPSYQAVQVGHELLEAYDQQPPTWPEVNDLISEIEAGVLEQYGGPLETPTLPTWDEVISQVAAQKAAADQPRADETASSPAAE